MALSIGAILNIYKSPIRLQLIHEERFDNILVFPVEAYMSLAKVKAQRCIDSITYHGQHYKML